MKPQIIRLISILILGFVLLFSNVQQINFLSLQNRRAINLIAETNSLQLKKESLLLQNNNKFVDDIDKKIEKNEVQQIVVGIGNNQTSSEVAKKQNSSINISDIAIVAR